MKELNTTAVKTLNVTITLTEEVQEVLANYCAGIMQVLNDCYCITDDHILSIDITQKGINRLVNLAIIGNNDVYSLGLDEYMDSTLFYVHLDPMGQDLYDEHEFEQDSMVEPAVWTYMVN